MSSRIARGYIPTLVQVGLSVLTVFHVHLTVLCYHYLSILLFMGIISLSLSLSNLLERKICCRSPATENSTYGTNKKKACLDRSWVKIPIPYPINLPSGNISSCDFRSVIFRYRDIIPQSIDRGASA